MQTQKTLEAERADILAECLRILSSLERRDLLGERDRLRRFENLLSTQEERKRQISEAFNEAIQQKNLRQVSRIIERENQCTLKLLHRVEKYVTLTPYMAKLKAALEHLTP